MTKITLKIFIFLTFSIPIFAGKGMVLVFETPIYSSPNLDSKVLGYLQKGAVTYIHNKHYGMTPTEVNYNVDKEGDALSSDDYFNDEKMYQTLTRDGVNGYVPVKYIKLIYNDFREFDKVKVNKFSEYDPTDYRIEEPLPESYPLYDPRSSRAFLTMSGGTAPKNGFKNYDEVSGEQLGNRFGLTIGYLRKIHFDPYDRLYFGGLLQFYGQRSLYQFGTVRNAQETHGQIGLGPFLSFDIYRTKTQRLSLYGGITYDYHRYLIQQQTREGEFEERLFSGLSLSPKIGATFAFKNIIRGTNLDLLIGTESELNLPYTLTTTSQGEITGFWNGGNEMTFPLGMQFSLFMGIQSHY